MTPDGALPFDEDPGRGEDASSAAQDQPRAGDGSPPEDLPAREAAVDPTRNVVLEASAGTGKTRVLVDRYLNLLHAGVEPVNILAITFTRKAASEMRQRIVSQLRSAASRSPEEAARWRSLRDRLNEITISTIDAFCLSLLREFPLEADLDPGFEVADETEIPRLAAESLDHALRICRRLGTTDPDIALVFAQLGEFRLREGLSALLERRLIAGEVLRSFLEAGPRDMTIDRACSTSLGRLRAALDGIPGGLGPFLDAGPLGHPRFAMLARDLRACVMADPALPPPRVDPSRLRDLIERVHAHFFTNDNKPRKLMPRDYKAGDHASPALRRQHVAGLVAAAPAVADAIRAYRRDVNVVLSRGVYRMFGVATSQFEHTLEAHGVLDFAGLLARASLLLGQMDEFARSRYRLESRYHHILVDEFQDTSRAQWGLVSHLIRSWGEGFGLAHEAPLTPSIFIVGDRKQSIYGFRDADVALLDTAAETIASLRPEGQAVQSIAHSFRSVPELLSFANDLFEAVEKTPDRADRFRFDARDVFPLDAAGTPEPSGDARLGIIAGPDPRACAESVGEEIARLLSSEVVRDRQTGLHRPVQPADIAILFRSRESHRAFEQALEARGIPTYVYKGLGFFDADEIKDVVALVRYLADPASDLRAAALLRSGFVRLSDVALSRMARHVAASILGGNPGVADRLDPEDRGVFERLRSGLDVWLPLVDRIPPSELLDRILSDTAYEFELRGPRLGQARENLKKIRSIIRRIQNRGYLTFGRLSEHLDRLSTGDESNATVDAIDAVSLMTVHASKGLEFPVVFVVNLSRGTGGARAPIRVAAHAAVTEAVAIGDFESEADEDARARDREESKRLLYVAVTRARDRLYFGSVVTGGTFRARSGGLGEVLPDEVRGLFEEAFRASPPVELAWVSRSGRRHRFRICTVPGLRPDRAAAQAGFPAVPSGSGAEDRSAPDDFSPVVDNDSVHRLAVTEIAAATPGDRRSRLLLSQDEAAEVGILVHRLFQETVRTREAADGDRLRQMARALHVGAAPMAGGPGPAPIESPERPSPATDPDLRASIEAQAVELFSKMRSHREVAAVLVDSECLFEVPISFRLDTPLAASLLPDWSIRPEGPNPPLLRGRLDCLALRRDGSVTVLDFKTGAPKPADRVQIRVYLAAVRALYPGRNVSGFLVYPDAATGV